MMKAPARRGQWDNEGGVEVERAKVNARNAHTGTTTSSSPAATVMASSLGPSTGAAMGKLRRH